MNVLLPGVALLLLSTATETRLTVPGTSVSLALPAGFAPMPADVIALKYSRGGKPPTQVYSTPGPSYAVNIAFALRDVKLPAGSLAPAQTSIERSIAGTPGLRWLERGVKRVGDREWIVLRFWVDGLDQPIYNHLRVTREGDKTLLVTANVTKTLYPQYAAKLDAAMNSLK
ncbi:hypothetical protein DAERI_050155 [Deinococcus aerius]|uniref:DUF1795 domain-containing protein n=1 Tax=Deinococcus aerius TaxID=200253 RepID=A0A2I9D4S2_9DEIO|nr:hypothetical protein [Deinococcus aerius]GBF05646.1 hypothetical protein DAERI_050155 [Deinococcus aerius]